MSRCLDVQQEDSFTTYWLPAMPHFSSAQVIFAYVTRLDSSKARPSDSHSVNHLPGTELLCRNTIWDLHRRSRKGTSQEMESCGEKSSAKVAFLWE